MANTMFRNVQDIVEYHPLGVRLTAGSNCAVGPIVPMGYRDLVTFSIKICKDLTARAKWLACAWR
jgi:hypothetical protein